MEKRDEQTLLPIIQKWIKLGTVIISDCWKAFCNVEKHGYTHRTVSHSIEFVNDSGDSTNKIEGHWQHAKVKMPPFRVKKHHFLSYLAEFMWCYRNKDNDLFMFLQDVKKIYSVNLDLQLTSLVTGLTQSLECKLHFLFSFIEVKCEL